MIEAATSFNEPDRRRMVLEQIRDRGVRDPRVLAAAAAVPRHEFVPAELRAHAYEDRPLPIGAEQTISQPYIVAFMTEALGLGENARVLEIGTGSGYQTAVLALVAGSVYTVENRRALSERAQSVLARLGIRNVSFRVGDGYEGWPEEAPFDAILVTASPRFIPDPLVAQLAPGGSLVLPVGGKEQVLVRVRKDEDGTVRQEPLANVRFVPLTAGIHN